MFKQKPNTNADARIDPDRDLQEDRNNTGDTIEVKDLMKAGNEIDPTEYSISERNVSEERAHFHGEPIPGLNNKWQKITKPKYSGRSSRNNGDYRLIHLFCNFCLRNTVSSTILNEVPTESRNTTKPNCKISSTPVFNHPSVSHSIIALLLRLKEFNGGHP